MKFAISLVWNGSWRSKASRHPVFWHFGRKWPVYVVLGPPLAVSYIMVRLGSREAVSSHLGQNSPNALLLLLPLLLLSTVVWCGVAMKKAVKFVICQQIFPVLNFLYEPFSHSFSKGQRQFAHMILFVPPRPWLSFFLWLPNFCLACSIQIYYERLFLSDLFFLWPTNDGIYAHSLVAHQGWPRSLEIQKQHPATFSDNVFQAKETPFTNTIFSRGFVEWSWRVSSFSLRNTFVLLNNIHVLIQGQPYNLH